MGHDVGAVVAACVDDDREVGPGEQGRVALADVEEVDGHLAFRRRGAGRGCGRRGRGGRRGGRGRGGGGGRSRGRGRGRRSRGGGGRRRGGRRSGRDGRDGRGWRRVGEVGIVGVCAEGEEQGCRRHGGHPGGRHGPVGPHQAVAFGPQGRELFGGRFQLVAR